MAKGEERGQPITEESLVHQGNEKCYQFRKKSKAFDQLMILDHIYCI